MPQHPRVTQKVFGADGSANPNFIQFGSLAASSTLYTKNLATIQALTAFTQGWQNATVGDDSPALEDMNSLFLLAFSQLAYVLQQGIPAWDAGTVYYQNGFASSGGVVYVSLVDNNTAAVSDTNSWSRLVKRQQTALAWAFFSGTAGDTSLTNAFNISTISRDGVGAYTLTFSTPMLNTNYVIIANGTTTGTVSPWQRGQFLTEFIESDGTPVKTTNTFGLQAGSESDTPEDCYRGYVVIYGD